VLDWDQVSCYSTVSAASVSITGGGRIDGAVNFFGENMMLFYFRIATLIYYTLPAIIITSPSTHIQILALPLMRMIAKQISGKVNQICGRCS
jgi:hypothetical protein